MPITINGIGTTYYGKKNIYETFDTCEFCGKSAVITSYDTMLFFVFVYIPVIPLGRKRILNMCDRCKKHNVVSLKKWQEARETEIKEAGEKYKSGLHNPEAAQNLIRIIVAYQSPEFLKAIAPTIESNLSNNFEVMKLLGAAFEVFKKHEEAERFYKTALSLNNDPEIRIMLATCLINNRKPLEAAPLMGHLLKQDSNGYNSLMYLVEGLQDAGKHKEATELMTKIREVYPSRSAKRDFRKKLKVSKKHARTGKHVVSKTINQMNIPINRVKETASAFIWVMAGILSAIVLTGYLITAISSAKSRKVWVVNGLDRPYTVSINGQSWHLNSRGRRVVQLQEGDVSVTVKEKEIGIPDISLQIQTFFFTRPFKDHMFIINPDQTAIFLFQDVLYAQHASDQIEPDYQYRTGSALYHFEGIDYEFQAPPETLMIESSKERKQSVEFMRDLSSPALLLPLTGEFLEYDNLVTCLEKGMTYDPDNIEIVNTYSSAVEPEKFLQFIRSGLDDRPLKMVWHRAYQEQVSMYEPEYDLLTEYEAYVQAEPDNMDLLYLLGRASPGDDGYQHFTRAATSNPPSAYALHALAWRALMHGDKEEAFTFSSRAMDIDPQNDTFRLVFDELLYATDRHELMLKRLNDSIKPKSTYFMAMNTKIRTLIALGREEEVPAEIENYCRAIKPTLDDESFAYIHCSLTATEAYCTGDFNTFAELAKLLPIANVIAKCEGGDPEGADEVVEQIESPDLIPYLALYTSAKLNGKDRLADKYLDMAIEVCENGLKSYEDLGDILKSGEADQEALNNLDLYPPTKRAALAAIATRVPSVKKEAITLAKKLNYLEWPPQKMIAQMTVE